MLAFAWPLILIVVANIAYQICAKEIPTNMDTAASMIITYLVGAVCSAIMYFAMNRGGNLVTEFQKTNAAPFILGAIVVCLELGFIYAYKVGWQVSILSIVQSAILAVALIFVGAGLYHETITLNKIIGVVCCLVGLFFLNR